MQNKIKEFRKKRKITQEELAFELRVTRQTINAIEQGKYSPSLELAFKIAIFFETTVDDLFIFKTD
ncbi:helix-turn-helix transcriptional regulator [Methanococcoides sp. LMO-2]|uniref:Helix-turn-helix transcriptional regulator n=1 Tax=Methanococcoides cohabitans TaxID=3136559 RepID=A0ABU9KS80_9EURY